MSTVKEICQPLLKSSADICNELPWENPEFYASWLGQMHYFLVHATRMLQFAGSMYKLEDDNLHIYCLDHSLEEKNHDKLAAVDIKRLGFKTTDFPELPETAQLYQSQYYYMQHENPAALFGNIYYLEGLATVVDPEIVENIVSAHGKEKCSLLLCHIDADTDHVDDIVKLIDTLDAPKRAAALKSFELSKKCYDRMLLTLRDKFKSSSKGSEVAMTA